MSNLLVFCRSTRINGFVLHTSVLCFVRKETLRGRSSRKYLRNIDIICEPWISLFAHMHFRIQNDHRHFFLESLHISTVTLQSLNPVPRNYDQKNILTYHNSNSLYLFKNYICSCKNVYG